MPAKDLYHDNVKNALIKDGWTITHDPYTISFGQKDVFVDIGAEKAIAAQKQGEKIAVEIKSFLGASDIRDLEMAVGQYVFYRSLISRLEPERKLFLAVPEIVFNNTLKIALIAFNPQQEIIVKWIS